MTTAAAVTTPAVTAIVRRTAVSVALAAVDGFANAAEDEDVVVHREPKEDDEQEEGQPGDDRAVGLEAKDRLGPAVLEDEREHAVGGRDREQVERDGLERDDDRAEGDEEQAEGEREHEGEHVGQCVADLAGEVDVFGGGAGDSRLGARIRARGSTGSAAAAALDGVAARAVCAVAGQR